MATSQVSVVREALRSAIAAVTDATVYAYPAGDGNTTNVGDYIELGDVSFDQEHNTFGGSRAETMAVTVMCYSRKSGGGQDTAKAAEDRALELFADVEAAIRNAPKLGLTSLTFSHAQVTGPNESQPMADAGNRINRIEGTVQVEVNI